MATLNPLPAAARRLIRCLLVSPLFFAGLAACSEAPAPLAVEPTQAHSEAAQIDVVSGEMGGYAPARPVSGQLVSFSQILPPAGPDGLVIGDVESQTGAALRLLDEALAEHGLDRADLVHLSIHVVVDADGQIDTGGVTRAWQRAFANAMQPAAPARTVIGVAALPAPGARVSLTALAEQAPAL